MIRLKTSLRRALAITAGTMLGFGVVVAVSAPASAHTASIDASYECDTATGKRIVNWTLRNDFRTAATVSNLVTKPGEVAGIENGAVIPQRQDGADGELTGTQTLSGDEHSATVSFTSIWSADGFTADNISKTVTFGNTCAPARAACVDRNGARFHHQFAVLGDKSTARVTLDDDITLCNGEPVTLVSYFAPRPEFSTPQYTFDSDTKTIDNEHRSVDLQVDVPDCNTQVDLFFGGENDIIREITDNGPRYGDRKLGTHSGLGGRSKGPGGAFNGGKQKCQQPLAEPVAQCDGGVSVNLSNNGKLSRYPVTFEVRAGNFSKEVTVAAGKAQTVAVPAGSGNLTITADGKEIKTFRWAAPQDCELPGVIVKSDCDTVTLTVQNPKGTSTVEAKVTYGSETKTVSVASGASGKVTFSAGKPTFATVEFPGLNVEPLKATLEKRDCPRSGGGGGGDTPSLPLTGPAAGIIAGSAAVLLIIGTVLFFVARRRRVTFTA